MRTNQRWVLAGAILLVLPPLMVAMLTMSHWSRASSPSPVADIAKISVTIPPGNTAKPVNNSAVTFYKDVVPVLQRNCQGCHRPGEIAPMSFLDYKSTRPWAGLMKNAVLLRKMPPWFADPRYGKFANDRRLPEADLKTLVAWFDAGAPQGTPKQAPPPAT